MWHRLFSSSVLALSLACCGESSFAAETSVGPTSAEEARILWTDGRAAYEARKYADAAPLLQRLVDRYPAYPGQIDAQYYLGRIYFELGLEKGTSASAVEPLKAFVQRKTSSPEAQHARVLLGEVALEQKKYRDAYLISIEVERAPASSPEVQILALVLKSKALLALKQELQADAALTAAQQKLRELDPAPPAVVAEVSLAAYLIQTTRCQKLPSPGLLTEGQLREQMQRRGQCVFESSQSLHAIFKSDEPRLIGLASLQLRSTFEDYVKACAHPPLHAGLRRGKTVQQFKRFSVELRDRITLDCNAQRREILDLVASWKDLSPSAVSRHKAILTLLTP